MARQVRKLHASEQEADTSYERYESSLDRQIQELSESSPEAQVQDMNTELN